VRAAAGSLLLKTMSLRCVARVRTPILKIAVSISVSHPVSRNELLSTSGAPRTRTRVWKTRAMITGSRGGRFCRQCAFGFCQHRRILSMDFNASIADIGIEVFHGTLNDRSDWKHDPHFYVASWTSLISIVCMSHVRFRRSTKILLPQEGRGVDLWDYASCGHRMIALPGKGDSLLRALLDSVKPSEPSSDEATDRAWLADRYRANQQSRWWWRHRERARVWAIGGRKRRTTVFLYSFPGHVGGLSRQTYVNANGSGR